MATHNGNALPKFTYYADLASELVSTVYRNIAETESIKFFILNQIVCHYRVPDRYVTLMPLSRSCRINIE